MTENPNLNNRVIGVYLAEHPTHPGAIPLHVSWQQGYAVVHDANSGEILACYALSEVIQIRKRRKLPAGIREVKA